MRLSTYLRALRRGWWIILVAAILGIGLGYARNATSTPVYASHLTFYVGTPGGITSNSQYSNNQFAQERANSYVQLLSSERLARLVIADTGLKVGPGLIQGETSASVPLNTVLVKATVLDTDPARALKITTSMATQFPKMVNELDNVGLDKPAVVLSVVSGPSGGSVPVSPRKSVNYALGLGAGLILGLAVALLRELRDTSIRTPAQLTDLFDLPDIGTIPFDSSVRTSPLMIGDAAEGRRAEAMRQLRTNLEFVSVDSPTSVIMVTSATASEGKSTSATNLALAFAETHDRVLLVEADLRRPRVTDLLNVERVVGLSSVLAGKVPVDTALQRWGPSLTVLPSGPKPPNASTMLSSARMKTLMTDLRERFDVIIVDTPPVLPVTDAALISTLVDAVVVIARYSKVTRTQMTTAIKNLQAVKAPLVGFVLNMIPRGIANQYGGRYDGYGYREDVEHLDDAEEAPVLTPVAGADAGPRATGGANAESADRAQPAEAASPASRRTPRWATRGVPVGRPRTGVDVESNGSGDARARTGRDSARRDSQRRPAK